MAKACETQSEPVQAMRGKLSAFKDLVVTDSTVMKLHDFLTKIYPSTRKGRGNKVEAMAKLHLVMIVSAVSPRSVKITSARTNDGKVLKIGPWVKDRLMLMDLGFFEYNLFDRIDRNKGFFISRLMKHVNPTVIKDHLGTDALVGKRLQEVLSLKKQEVLDLEVEATYRKGKYRGKRRRCKKSFRMAGIMNHETGEYHIYITNVNSDVLSAEDIALTYKARWEVELIFKELKNYYRLDQFPSKNKYIVESLIYVAILTLIASRKLLFALRRLGKISPSRSPERRWAAIFVSMSNNLLNLIFSPEQEKEKWRRLEIFLLKDMVDPNVKRSRNLAIMRA